MDPLQMLLQQASNVSSSAFAENSRYRNIEVAYGSLTDGRQVNYLRRRFLPQPEQMQTIAEHKLCEDERLDQIANRYLGDPEKFWQVCDANRAMRPADLTDKNAEETHERIIRIAAQAGMPAQRQG